MILSINDTPEIRAVFSGLPSQPVQVTYSISEAPPKEFGELIITNFDHPLLKDTAAL